MLFGPFLIFQGTPRSYSSWEHNTPLDMAQCRAITRHSRPHMQGIEIISNKTNYVQGQTGGVGTCRNMCMFRDEHPAISGQRGKECKYGTPGKNFRQRFGIWQNVKLPSLENLVRKNYSCTYAYIWPKKLTVNLILRGQITPT